MSLFGSFASRKTSKDSTARTLDNVGDLPNFALADLVNKDEIGRGGFATVFTAEFPSGGGKVVVKKFLVNGDEEGTRRLVLKEAKLLNSLTHPNIAKFKGICNDDYAILLEYMFFDFKPFDLDFIVNCLSDLLCHFDKSDCQNISKVVLYQIASDVASGLQYLHEKGIAHRDLKPANILVSNQHYCQLSDKAAIEEVSTRMPLICKLTDFGESRSQEIHTNTILTSKTTRINRGTPVFMAPEILVNDCQLTTASTEDLKKADIWAFGMVMFNLTNPGLKHPYQINMESKRQSRETHLQMLKTFVKVGEKPIAQKRYAAKQSDDWRGLVAVYERCTKFRPSRRPDIIVVVEAIHNERSSTSPARSEVHPCPRAGETIHLKVCQSSFLENYDRHISLVIESEGKEPAAQIPCSPSLLDNDGTNACSFLSLKIADEISLIGASLTWMGIAEVAENIIEAFPRVVNQFRDVSKKYDVLEAYGLMKDNGCLSSTYDFSEELPYSYGVFTKEGKTKFVEATTAMVDGKDSIGVYTCEPYIFILGSRMGSVFILDTHSVPASAGGESSGILKIFSGTAEVASQAVCKWIWQRLSCSGVKRALPQSLSVMTKTEMSSPDPKTAPYGNKIYSIQEDKLTLETGSDHRNNNETTKDALKIVSDSGGNDNNQVIAPTRKEDDIVEIVSSDDEQLLNSKKHSPKKRKIEIDSSSTGSDDCIITHDINKSLPKSKKAGDPYGGDDSLPVYQWGSGNKGPADVLKVLLKPVEDALVCKKAPISVSHNVCFLLDTTLLNSINDWKCDDMGSWKNNGVVRNRLVLRDGEIFAVSENKVASKNENVKTLKRIYYKNKSSPDLKKIASYIEDFPHLIFLQYLFDGKEHSVEPATHGNCKRQHSSLYVRTKESTISQLRHEARAQMPKAAYHTVHKEQGGIMNASSISDLPRNLAQAKYLRRGNTQPKSFDNIDSLLILLEQCKRQQLHRDEQPFIREVTGAPELRCILGFDWQLRDIATFCTDPLQMSVFGADPTFNLGRFNVTVTSLQNLKVVDRVNGHHPTMIGPMLLSQTKSFDSYNQFFGKIVSLDKRTRGILAFGTDGEEELYKAMKFSFPHALHLRCFNHFRDNCKDKLKSSNVPEEVQKEFIHDIFGRRAGEIWEKGLVDADNAEDFRAKLLAVKEPRNSKEKQYLPNGVAPKFYDYIVEKEETIILCMLKETRRNAGLGDPPSPYYNNIPESANAMIKRGVNFKESEMTKFCNDMSTLLLCQREDVESTIINKGPYRLAPKFSSFEVKQSTWFKMSAKQRDTHLKRFHEAKMSETTDDADMSSSSVANSHSSRSSMVQVRLSTDLVGSGIKSAPVVMLRSISEKAEKLLNKEGSVVRAPGSTDGMAYVVESHTSVKPHYVVLSKNGKVTCQDCPNWKASKICAHAVAAAEKSGITTKYIKWIREKGPANVNITALMTFDSSNGTGKKGGKGSTARRKGGRTAQQPPATTVVDRPGFMSTSSPSDVQIQAPTVASTFFQAPVSTVPLLPQSMQSPAPARSVNPTVGTFVLNLLQFCPPLVRSCYGCSQSLKPGGVIAKPPYDMSIITRMNRGFRATPCGEMMFKESNVYFHVHLNCIRMKQPYFCPQSTVVPNWLIPYLTPEHVRFLREFGLPV